jgi:hypothetical protein
MDHIEPQVLGLCLVLIGIIDQVRAALRQRGLAKMRLPGVGIIGIGRVGLLIVGIRLVWARMIPLPSCRSPWGGQAIDGQRPGTGWARAVRRARRAAAARVNSWVGLRTASPTSCRTSAAQPLQKRSRQSGLYSGLGKPAIPRSTFEPLVQWV